jgi:WD40 repeat protein
MQNCIVCQEPAEFSCSCANVFVCTQHFGSHLLLPGSHSTQRITFKLDSAHFSVLCKEIAKRTKSINDCKSKIRSHATLIIEQIYTLCNAAIEKLEKLQVQYNSYISSKDYTRKDLEDIKRLVTTNLTLKFDPDFNKSSKFAEFFCQNFVTESAKDETKRLSEFLNLHNGRILSVAVMKKTNKIVSAGDDTSIKIWDRASCTVENVLEGHSSKINSIAINSSDSILVSGSNDRTVRIWDMERCREIYAMKEHTAPVLTVAISADDKWAASGGPDTVICLWSLSELSLNKKIYGHSGCIKALLFADSALFSGALDGMIVNWDYSTGKQRSSITDYGISCLAISKDCTTVVSGSKDRDIKIWINYKSIAVLKGHDKTVNAVIFANEENFIVSASEDYLVIVWSVKYHTRLCYLVHHSHSVTCLSNLTDLMCVSGSCDGCVIVWDLSKKELFSAYSNKRFSFFHSVFWKNFLVYASMRTVVVWNLEWNCVEVEFSGHEKPVCCVDMNDVFLVSGSEDFSVRLWSVAEKGQTALFSGHTDRVLSVILSEKVAISGSADKTIMVWDLQSKKIKGALLGHAGAVNSIALGKNKEMLVSGSSDGTLKVWNITAMEVIFTFEGQMGKVAKVGISNDELYAFSGAIGQVSVWNIVIRKKLAVLDYIKSRQMCTIYKVIDAETWIGQYPELRSIAQKYLSE